MKIAKPATAGEMTSLCREHFDKATKLKLEGKSMNEIVKEFRS